MSVSKSTGITVDQELVERCDRLRLAGPCSQYSPPEPPPRNGGKIIPFPGVSTDTGGGIQDILDDFLREMGYVE
jgi:hypothetical protein